MRPLPVSRSFVLGLVAAVGVACSTTNNDPVANGGTTARRCLPTKTSQTGFEIMGFKGDLIETADYNGDRQLTKLTQEITISPSLPKQTLVQAITYLPGRIEATTSMPGLGSSGGLKTTYTQNSAGLITGINMTLSSAGSASALVSLTNAYNADGYLSRQTDAQGNYSTFDYAGGNIATVKSYNKAGTLLSTQTFSYYTDRTMNVPMLRATVGADAAFYAAGLLGKQIKNPVKQVTTSEPNGPVTNFTYTYDADGNISSIDQKTAGKSVLATSTTKYSYTCF
jgi:hypothetical protein